MNYEQVRFKVAAKFGHIGKLFRHVTYPCRAAANHKSLTFTAQVTSYAADFGSASISCKNCLSIRFVNKSAGASTQSEFSITAITASIELFLSTFQLQSVINTK